MESKQTAFSSSYKKYENLLGTTPQQMDNKTNLNSYLFFSSHLNSMVANHRQCQRRNNFQDSSKSPSEPIFNLNNSYMSDSFTSSFDCSEQTGTLNESFLNLSMATNNATGSDQDGNHLVYLKSKNKQYILSNSHLISSKHKSLRRTESEFIKSTIPLNYFESCKEHQVSPIQSLDFKNRPILKKKESTEATVTESMIVNLKRPRSTYPFGKCKVCSDKATGIHYGIATCEGCKGFFKRCTLKKEKYRCFFGNNCLITPKNRNRCKSCRFNKCLEVNMSIQGAKMGRIPKSIKEQAIKKFNESKNEIESKPVKSTDYDTARCRIRLETESFDQIAPNTDRSIFALNTNVLVNHQNDYLQCISPVSSVSLSEYIEPASQKIENQIERPSLNSLPILTRRNTWELCSKHTNSPIPHKLFPFTSKGLAVTYIHCKELDHNYQFTLSLLGNKMYQIHMKNQEKIMYCQRKALDLIYSNSYIENENNVSLKVVWRALLKSMSNIQKHLIELTREIPGLADLKENDLNMLINKRSFEYYLIRNAPLFINNECFIYLSNEIRFTRKSMVKIIGLEMTCRIFKFAHEINSLRISDKEMAFIISIVLTKFSQEEETLFEDAARIQSLNEHFFNGLLYEFDLNSRNQIYVGTVKKLLNDLLNMSGVNAERLAFTKP